MSRQGPVETAFLGVHRLLARDEADPVASGWSGCRVGLAPTGKRRLVTAHANSGHFGIHSITPFRRSVLLDPLVPDLRRRATSSRCRGARAGDCRDLLQQCFLRLRQIERITVGLMISGASVPVDLDQIFFRISEIKGE